MDSRIGKKIEEQLYVIRDNVKQLCQEEYEHTMDVYKKIIEEVMVDCQIKKPAEALIVVLNTQQCLVSYIERTLFVAAFVEMANPKAVEKNWDDIADLVNVQKMLN